MSTDMTHGAAGVCVYCLDRIAVTRCDFPIGGRIAIIQGSSGLIPELDTKNPIHTCDAMCCEHCATMIAEYAGDNGKYRTIDFCRLHADAFCDKIEPITGAQAKAIRRKIWDRPTLRVLRA